MKQKHELTTFSRLTETARLLRNVRNVFSRRSNTRVNMELELSREYQSNQKLQISISVFIEFSKIWCVVYSKTDV